MIDGDLKENTKKPHNMLTQIMNLCWATFKAVLGHMHPVGCRLDSLV